MEFTYKGCFYKLVALFAVVFALVSSLGSCGRTRPASSGTDDGYETSADGAGRATSDETTDDSEPDRNKTICIDPGHGFGDVGAQSEYIGDLDEKDINLTFSKHLRDELLSRGYQVFLTHDGVSFPETDVDNGNDNYDFKERTEYANSVGMDYFISIHCNTYDGYQDVQGVRIYYSEDSRVPVKEPKAASEYLCEALKKAFPNYREPLSYMTAADNSYYVTHWAESCALLIEIGYLTNEDDAENMLDKGWNLKMTEAIADGIDAYFTK